MDSRSAIQRLLAASSAVVALLTTAVYVAVIREQGDTSLGEVLPWVAIMLLGALLALGSAATSRRVPGQVGAAAGAVVLGLLGLLAIFSVGLGFMLAALLALLAAVVPAPLSRQPAG